MAFTFTQLTSDSFQRANENPLDPSQLIWPSAFTPGGTGFGDQLEILNNKCVITITPDQDGGACNKAISWPADQYCGFTVVDCLNSGFALYSRTVPYPGSMFGLTPCYRFSLSGSFNNGGTFSSGFIVDEVNLLGNAIVYSWTGIQKNVPITFQSGDTFKFGVIGTKASGGHLYVFHNEILIYTANLADDTTSGLISGNMSMQLFSDATPQSQLDISVINFVGGSFSGGPDTKVTSNYPGSFSAQSLKEAFYNPNQLDLMQVINDGGNVVWNLTATGVSNFNPGTSTNQTILGKFFGQTFQQAFPNSNQLDILQVISKGNAVIFHVNYLGIANFL